jgi:hypothetical protein
VNETDYLLFEIDEGDTIVTIDKATGLDQVKDRLTALTALKPSHRYFIYDRIAAKFVEPFKKSA